LALEVLFTFRVAGEPKSHCYGVRYERYDAFSFGQGQIDDEPFV